MTAAKKKLSRPFIPCAVKRLPKQLWLAAAQAAVEVNPSNAPLQEGVYEPGFLAVVTTKYWGVKGVKLGVAFLDTTDRTFKTRILSHMNAWGEYSNVQFLEASASMAQVRITRTPGHGYYSYLGTDVLQIPKGQCTMNLDRFAMSTPESEYKRVVRHETGHTLGFPHEHMRKKIVERLDEKKTIAYFGQTQGWSEAEVRQQVLTPIEEQAILATPQTDEASIMAYQLPGSITKDGKPVVGGTDINDTDAGFVADIYPLATPAPPSGRWTITITGTGDKPVITTS